ncbi:chromate efflux transporter [Deinococcus sp.]|uniref:chromate efflux transporter n=1 Tax=Deinococcus sp. TaxID=47478 RepID=UPI0025BBF5CA|nr:chromate efflux transporter [Deinococcus sp.]
MRVLEVFLVFLRLGLTSFGGPVAHLGYFRAEFVTRRAWLGEAAYADLVALAGFLPGPASSQVGLSVGLLRAGWLGLLAAWAGFTLPSAALMTALALGTRLGDPGQSGWLTGLKVAAVAVVAQAVAGLWASLVTGRVRAGLALGTAAALLLWPGAGAQVLALLVCAGVGWRWLSGQVGAGGAALTAVPVSRRAGSALLLLAGALLLALPLLAALGPGWAILDATYRAGALVFGGGHVVLPLLEGRFANALPPGTFTAGYGAANAMPGPLFTFATFLGAAAHGLAGALIATLGIFLPGALLMVGALPHWAALAARPAARAALAGLNAGVVGLLLAALYNPVFTSAVRGPRDLALAVLAYAALTVLRWPAWAVVLACAGAGWAAL